MIQMAEIKLSDKEIAAATEVLRSGGLRQGKECEAFEHEFSQKVGSKFALTNSSGTAALQLAYSTFLEKGDEVLIPSFSFIATASMVSLSGGTPIFCDINPQSFLMCLKDAEKKITAKTKAIGPVHLFGNACDVDEVIAFAKLHKLKIVWDAAQAHGARYKGKDIGSFGDFVCYSFYPSKNMFVGEGGMTCCGLEHDFEKMRDFRSHGQTGKYYHTSIGLNARMTDVEAAIGREQLKRLDCMLEVRRRNAEIYNQAFEKLEGLTPQKKSSNVEHAYHLYCVAIDENLFGCDRDTLASMLHESGVLTGIHYPRGLHQQPVYQEKYGITSLPITEWISQNILALPIHHGISQKDASHIIDSVFRIHERVKRKQ